MAGPLIAIVGDISSTRNFDPQPRDSINAKKAAEQLGAELAKQGARLLVYGGPFLETDVVRGYVAAKPKDDNSILMWFTVGNEPPAFPEESSNQKLFQRTGEKGADWEIAFYRSITRADCIILMGGGNATKISGQVAIGSRMPILALSQFGGGASRVWETLSAGEDLPNREEIDLMAKPWNDESAAHCVKALFAQHARKQYNNGEMKPGLIALAGFLFLVGLAIVPWIFGANLRSVWMLFFVPLVVGGAGATIRRMVDHLRGTPMPAQAALATIVLGFVAGGIAGIFFVTAQIAANLDPSNLKVLDQYATKSIPFSLAVGFIAGLTSDAVFGKLLGLDAVRTTGFATGAVKSGV